MWYEESIFYQIYPLGFTGAPKENDGVTVNRIEKVKEWIPHLKQLGINAVYFSPIFESDRHGYDTRDYQKIDCRLGTNEDFADVAKALHKEGIRIVLDGVFNHVGRGFFAFQDVLVKRQNSKYKDWFHIDFNRNSNYNDGLWYEGWEGHYELVKLNLSNDEVVNYLFDSIRKWVKLWDIDGLRLDVAYCLDKNFLKKLRHFCDCELGKKDFFLVGEVLFGDYNQIANQEMCHSVTNYECYKGLYSSFNSKNMFEISHSLARQFGTENWCIYRGKHFLSFVDNHDVSRVASILENRNDVPLIYAVLFGMPGIPCIYYGSEWAAKGEKAQGDDALRPSFEKPEWNGLTSYLQKLIQIRKEHEVLTQASYRAALLTNEQLVIAREGEEETLYIGVNITDREYEIPAGKLGNGKVTELLTQEERSLDETIIMPEYGVFILQKK